MDQDPSDFARRQPGLTESEATLLLAQVGPNVIRTEQIRTVFHIIAETLREPTFVLLLVAGGLYLVLSETSAKACLYARAPLCRSAW